MHSTKCELDGVFNGIGAFIRSRNDWLKLSDGKHNLFTNFKALNGRLAKEHIDYHDVIFRFIIQDKVTGKHTLNYDEAVSVDGGWKISRYETIFGYKFLHIYDIKESVKDQVVDINYISSKAAGTHDPNKDPKFEYKKLKDIRKIINECMSSLTSYQIYGCSVSSTKYGLEIKLDKSSASIHIWTNAKVMDYNTEVKKHRDADSTNTTRCLQYLKDQDKYGTLYMFATCDENDCQDAYTLGIIEKFKNEFLTLLQEKHPDEDIRYLPCQINGKIILNLSNEEG